MSARALLVLAIAFGLFACEAYDRNEYNALLDASLDRAETASDVPIAEVTTTDHSDIAVDHADGGDAHADASDVNDGGCAPCASGQTCCAGACVDVQFDPNHCGTCGVSCQGTTCSSGLCTSECVLGRLNCDGTLSNGCEVNAATDPLNCGGCGHACPNGRSCQLGACVCPTGLADCDANPANGCEVTLATDSNNCGTCSNQCAAGQLCSAGACACMPGFSDCNANPTDGCEANTSTDAANCGTCGHACGANSTCSAGACVCATGFLRCPSTAAGCTTSSLDPNNCGSCGMVCASSAPLCTATGCVASCPTGTTLCTGSCADLTSDAFNCGACGTRCPTAANAMPQCTMGTCGATCLAGYADCDANLSNGCETATASNAANCGSCGHTCSSTQVCSGGACICPAGTRDCGNGQCATCCANGDCNDGNGCTTDTCTGGTCSHAGCATGTLCCGMLSCNACCTDADCTALGGNRGCSSSGTCTVCLQGYADCNGQTSDGCEANTLTDVANCGACGNACSFPNATATCTSGACRIASCATGFANCDGTLANGCEVNLGSNASNCGACGTVCPAGDVCTAGTCTAQSCPTGFATCGLPMTCTVDIETDVNNCGGCGTRCSFANATPTCVNGVCTRGTCNAGYGDCDGNPSNGCEANLSTSSTNCGACGTVCTFPNASGACANATCTLGACNAGFGNCNGTASDGCETPLNTLTNCGGCGTTCTAPANATATCAAGGLCGFTCTAGWGDCDGNATNGCETNLLTTTTHCGSCATACSAPTGSSPTCNNGVCSTVCAADYGDCDGNPTNGCETALTSTTNCGACGVACTAGTNETAICAGGTCGFTCALDTANCDGDPANGCETSGCNGCAGACPSGPNATGFCSFGGWGGLVGACTLTCVAGWGNCDALTNNGCETNVNESAANCGACASSCTRECSAGSCNHACATGLTTCGGDCMNTASDWANCGSCGHACADAQTCSSGTCVLVACTVGMTACAGVCTNTATDAANCGTCHTVCPNGEVCVGGACTAPNDNCATVTPISLTSLGTSLSGTTVGASDSAGSCTTGPDVWYAFHLADTEVVYLDTFGSTANTIVGIVSGGCGTAPMMCNDDACGMTGSQLMAVLGPGLYDIVVDTSGTPGTFTLNFEHIPVSGPAAGTLAAGAYSVSGTTVGASNSPSTCGPGPDQWYYWTSCPSDAGGTLTASTCGSASFATQLQLRNGTNSGGGCYNNPCGSQGSISATVPAGAALHVLFVDGATSNASGTYTVTGSRP